MHIQHSYILIITKNSSISTHSPIITQYHNTSETYHLSFRKSCRPACLLVKILKFCAKWSPCRIQVPRTINFHHHLTFLQQLLLICTRLPYDLIPIQTKHKLRLRSHIVVIFDLRWYITINLKQLNLLEPFGNKWDMIFSNFTSRIPFRSEINHNIRIPIQLEIFVKHLQFGILLNPRKRMR